MRRSPSGCSTPTTTGRSLLPRQVFFPMAGENEGWARLARNLKAEIDEELIEAYRGTVSLPFEAGKHKRVAVKIVDDRGIESLRILDVARVRLGMSYELTEHARESLEKRKIDLRMGGMRDQHTGSNRSRSRWTRI